MGEEDCIDNYREEDIFEPIQDDTTAHAISQTDLDEENNIRDLCLQKGLMYFIGDVDVRQNKIKAVEFLTAARNLGSDVAAYLLNSVNPTGRITLYAAKQGNQQAKKNIESWREKARWRLTKDEWNEFDSLFHEEIALSDKTREEEIKTVSESSKVTQSPWIIFTSNPKYIPPVFGEERKETERSVIIQDKTETTVFEPLSLEDPISETNNEERSNESDSVCPKKTFDYSAFIIEESNIDPELYGWLTETELHSALSDLNYIRSQRYLIFLNEFLQGTILPETEEQERMVNMFYYSLFKELPEDKGFPSQKDFQEYLVKYKEIYPYFIDALRDEELTGKQLPLQGYSLDLHEEYSKNEILAALGYWTWNSRIPVREDFLYLQNDNTDILFITEDKEKTLFNDSETLQWSAPRKFSPHSNVIKRITNNDDTTHHTLLFVRSKDRTKSRANYFCLGEAFCQDSTSDPSIAISWKLSLPLSDALSNQFIPPQEIEEADVEPEISLPSPESPDELTKEELQIQNMLRIIVRKDKTRTTYKFSLFYAVVESCQKYAEYGVPDEEDPEKIAMPIGFIIWTWMKYYFPIFSNNKFISIMVGESAVDDSKRKSTIRDGFKDIVSYYEIKGGFGKFNTDLLYGELPPALTDNVFRLVKILRDVIVTNPMKYFGSSIFGGDYPLFRPIKQQTRMRSYEILNVDYIIHNCGKFTMNAELFHFLSGIGGKTIIKMARVVDLWVEFMRGLDENWSLTEDEIRILLPPDELRDD